MPDNQTYRIFAESLVQMGGEIALKNYRAKQFNTEWKADNTYVTQTDTEVERFMRDMIKNEFPDHAVFGEEFGGELNAQTPTWILDPLDGTTNFAHHIPLFCSMAALQIEGKIVASAVSYPIEELLISAAENGGATVNGAPFPPASTQQDLNSVTLLLDSGKSDQARADSFRFLAEHGSQFRSFRKFGCMVAPLIFATQGKLDVVMIFGVDLYDVAGLSLIFSEAEYVIMDALGNPWQKSTNGDFVISNKALQPKLQRLFQTKPSKDSDE